MFSDFGLKLSIFNLSTQRSVDINSPKFYNPGVAAKGFSYRPITSNLAVLTRSGGKDVISIHTKDTLDVTRSWWPDTIDAQGLCWSADGRWLVVWESVSQGHKILVYTADGHLFKTWNGPVPISEEDTDISLGAGIKLFDWARNGSLVAIGDYSRRVTILSTPSFTETTSLFHTASVKPADSLQVRSHFLSLLIQLTVADMARAGHPFAERRILARVRGRNTNNMPSNIRINPTHQCRTENRDEFRVLRHIWILTSDEN